MKYHLYTVNVHYDMMKQVDVLAESEEEAEETAKVLANSSTYELECVGLTSTSAELKSL